MKFRSLSIALIFLITLTSHSAHARRTETVSLTENEVKRLYKGFKEIKSFAIIAVSLIGETSKLALTEAELNQFAKEKFKGCFPGVKYDDISGDSGMFFALLGARERTVGNITFRVWVVGEQYPIVYHVKCDVGNFDNPSIWTEEILGYGSEKSTPEAIKQIVEEMMNNVSACYFKVNGQEA